jgi:hypothetical protein
LSREINPGHLLNVIYENNIELTNCDMPDRFVSLFDNKIRKILFEVNICDQVYNGHCKVEAANRMCLKSLNPKNLEGLNRIPQRVLSDGIDNCVGSFSGLFKLIYNQMQILDQWPKQSMSSC